MMSTLKQLPRARSVWGRRSARFALLWALCGLLGIPACAPSTASKPDPTETPAPSGQSPSPAISNTDPCAMRMHDISGALLFYYAAVHKLPPALADLKKTPLGAGLEFTCPASGQAYIYNPEGVAAPDGQSLLICYDPSPSHSGFRLAISVPATDPEGALVTKVVPVAEAHFQKAR